LRYNVRASRKASALRSFEKRPFINPIYEWPLRGPESTRPAIRPGRRKAFARRGDATPVKAGGFEKFRYACGYGAARGIKTRGPENRSPEPSARVSSRARVRIADNRSISFSPASVICDRPCDRAFLHPLPPALLRRPRTATPAPPHIGHGLTAHINSPLRRCAIAIPRRAWEAR
jgi:hypothetical protein